MFTLRTPSGHEEQHGELGAAFLAARLWRDEHDERVVITGDGLTKGPVAVVLPERERMRKYDAESLDPELWLDFLRGVG